MQKTVGLVDYGSGNLRSVRKALEACGALVQLVDHPKNFLSNGWDALLVPGVGCFGDCAQNLHRTGLWDPILQWLQEGKPYLGICLGYQLLFESSEESPDVKGFGILAGPVKHFPRQDSKLKVPHMGWNEAIIRRAESFQGIAMPVNFYFVHSYYPVPKEASIVTSECEYGVRFASSIMQGKIVGTQFHPEKSQSAGLCFLENFLHLL